MVVRVYQLKTDVAFKGAEFFALFDDDMKVLGPDLIGRNEYAGAVGEANDGVRCVRGCSIRGCHGRLS